MKVLKQGSENENVWKMKVTCTGKGWENEYSPCGALLEIKAQDVYKRSHTDYGGNTDIYYGITCPCCHCFTEINSQGLPSYVTANAKKYVPYNPNLD